MVSKFRRFSAAPEEVAPHPELPEAEGIGERVLHRIHEAFCGLHGHDSLRQFQKNRLFLKCVSCGHESPGWSLTEAPPRAVARADGRRRTLASAPQVGERKIA